MLRIPANFWLKRQQNYADSFAVRWTFTEQEEREVINSKLLAEKDIIDFAKKNCTLHAMISGRFHHKKLLPYNLGRTFIQTINLD